MSRTYSRNHPGQKVLFIDWETTGADFSPGLVGTFEKFQGISVGLVVASTDTLEELDSLYLELKFDDQKYIWDNGAEKIHGLSREHLETNGVPRDEALVEIIEFITKHFGMHVISMAPSEPTQKVCLGGHNLNFDIKATEQLFNDFGFNLGIHHVMLETSGAAFIAVNKYRSDDVFSFFGGAERGSHNALDDARLSLSVARGIRQLVSAALGE